MGPWPPRSNAVPKEALLQGHLFSSSACTVPGTGGHTQRPQASYQVCPWTCHMGGSPRARLLASGTASLGRHIRPPIWSLRASPERPSSALQVEDRGGAHLSPANTQAWGHQPPGPAAGRCTSPALQGPGAQRPSHWPTSPQLPIQALPSFAGLGLWTTFCSSSLPSPQQVLEVS